MQIHRVVAAHSSQIKSVSMNFKAMASESSNVSSLLSTRLSITRPVGHCW